MTEKEIPAKALELLLEYVAECGAVASGLRGNAKKLLRGHMAEVNGAQSDILFADTKVKSHMNYLLMIMGNIGEDKFVCEVKEMLGL
jgi:hypothetical protein